ncbi:hypothetical protein E2320_005766 [Naja naja]|nr:hypothetical protein E2320_005766 [Naja naja]
MDELSNLKALEKTVKCRNETRMRRLNSGAAGGSEEGGRRKVPEAEEWPSCDPMPDSFSLFKLHAFHTQPGKLREADEAIGKLFQMTAKITLVLHTKPRSSSPIQGISRLSIPGRTFVGAAEWTPSVVWIRLHGWLEESSHSLTATQTLLVSLSLIVQSSGLLFNRAEASKPLDLLLQGTLQNIVLSQFRTEEHTNPEGFPPLMAYLSKDLKYLTDDDVLFEKQHCWKKAHNNNNNKTCFHFGPPLLRCRFFSRCHICSQYSSRTEAGTAKQLEIIFVSQPGLGLQISRPAWIFFRSVTVLHLSVLNDVQVQLHDGVDKRCERLLMGLEIPCGNTPGASVIPEQQLEEAPSRSSYTYESNVGTGPAEMWWPAKNIATMKFKMADPKFPLSRAEPLPGNDPPKPDLTGEGKERACRAKGPIWKLPYPSSEESRFCPLMRYTEPSISGRRHGRPGKRVPLWNSRNNMSLASHGIHLELPKSSGIGDSGSNECRVFMWNVEKDFKPKRSNFDRRDRKGRIVV